MNLGKTSFCQLGNSFCTLCDNQGFPLLYRPERCIYKLTPPYLKHLAFSLWLNDFCNKWQRIRRRYYRPPATLSTRLSPDSSSSASRGRPALSHKTGIYHMWEKAWEIESKGNDQSLMGIHVFKLSRHCGFVYSGASFAQDCISSWLPR